MRRFLISLGLLVFTLAVILMSCRGAITRPVIFPAPKFKIKPQLPGGVIVAVSGERTAYGYYAKAGRKLVVLFHGNGEVMGSMQDLAAIMLREGFSVLMTEYPGYGYAAEFKASEENIYEDTAALLNFMGSEYGHTPEDIVLWGFSLGTGVAVEMAAQKHGSRIILMAPFTSAGDTAVHHLFFAARWLIVDDFNSLAKAAAIDYPTLIVHGERDSVIPFSMGKKLAATFPHAEFISVAGADHNDLFAHFDQGLWQRIIRFARG
jgi:pimeloyl-ACP methyl ester carboxylesterase